MAKFYMFLAISALICANVCQAQRLRSGRLTQRQQRIRYLSRQSAAEPETVTPYPTADELKPEIPFEEAPVANVPDVVYGPPTVTTYNVPDEVYGPPEVNENELPAETDAVAESFPVPSDGAQARLLAIRRRQAAAYRAQRSAKLRVNSRRFA